MPPRSERRLPTGTVTFWFTDIEGSTRLLAHLGERYADVLERHAEIIRDAIGAGGGTEVSTEGDSFFAVFPSAIGAVSAAAAAHRGLASEPWPDGAVVRVRIGMHTGEADLAGDNYVGLDVNRAARIGAAGHGGQVLVSGTTADLVADALPDAISARDLGPHRFKDLQHPVRVFQLDIDGIDDRFPPIRSLDTASGNLPRPLATFVGRKRELGAVVELLDSRRLVTLTGPGGTGKTRLALEAARAALDRFDDGAWFVDLAPIRDPALVPLAIARALEVVVDPGGDALQAATRHLEHRQTLVILDNFEQVLHARVAVASLLKTAERTAFLVTSREPLGIYGEQELPVPPFGEADSVALFVERAREIQPDFSLTERSASTVGRIVDHVGGLPLAVELAATQVRVLSPSSLLTRLEEHLPVLSVPDGGRPERQRTMDLAIAWSYDLLEASERRLFARLSTLPGGSSLAAAEALSDAGDAPGSMLEGLAALVRKNLLRQEDADDDEVRFRMLEPILEFATDKLDELGDGNDAHRRVSNYWLTFAAEAEGHLTGHEQAAWLDRCEREGPNLREALDWTVEAGEIDIGLGIATSLWRFWHQRGPIQEGREILDRLLALDGGSPTVRGRANGAAGGLAWWGGDFAATGRHYAAAIALLEGSGDRPGEAEALYNAGFATLWQAVLNEGMNVDRAEDLFRRALAVAESIDDRRGKARALRGLGFVTGVARGDAAGALPLFEQSVALAEEAGDRWEMNESIIGVGNAYRFSGHKEAAKREYLRGIDLMAETGNRPVVIGLVLLLSALEAETGRHDRVSRLWGAAESQRAASGAISPPASMRIIGDPVAEARAAIGDQAVEIGLAEGSAMDYESLIAFAHA